MVELMLLARTAAMVLNNYSPNSVTPSTTEVAPVSHSVFPVNTNSEKYVMG